MQKSFQQTFLNKTIQLDNIVSFFYCDLNPKFTSIGETHNYWEFIYADIGSVEIITGSKTVILEEGHIYFHAPNEYHRHRSIKNIKTSICNGAFYYEGNVLDKIADQPILLTTSMKHYFFNALKYCSEIFSSVIDTKELIYQIISPDHSPAQEQLLLNNLESFLLELLISMDTLTYPKRHVPEDEYPPLVGEAIMIMRQCLFSSLTLSSLCQKLHCSKSTLSAVFKKYTASTVMNYYTQLKIDKAKELLCLGTYNITQVSDFLNFCNVNYFSNQFKRYTNLKPSEYCKSLKNKNCVQLLELKKCPSVH